MAALAVPVTLPGTTGVTSGGGHIMLLLLALGACVHVHILEDSCTFDEAVSRVEADLGSGDLNLEPGDTLSVTRHLEYSGDEAPGGLDASVSGGVLTLPGECDDLRVVCSVSWTVTLPAGADLDLATGSGDLDIRGITGDARLETGSGDVVVKNGSGSDLVASTGSGDLEIEGDYLSFDLETGSGDVTLDAGDTATGVWLSTGSGDISAEVPGGSWAVDVDTGSGDVSMSGLDDDGGANRTLHASTGSGDVSIRGR